MSRMFLVVCWVILYVQWRRKSLCEAMQLQHGLVRIDRAKEARGTNPIEMNELIEENKGKMGAATC